MSNGLRERRPRNIVQSRMTARRELTHDQQDFLLFLIEPGSAENPLLLDVQV